MNKYAELRSRQQKEVNALPLGFAFSNRQFEEMMKGWGLDPEKDLDKIVSIGAGGYIQKKDRSLMHETFDRHRRERKEARDTGRSIGRGRCRAYGAERGGCQSHGWNCHHRKRRFAGGTPRHHRRNGTQREAGPERRC